MHDPFGPSRRGLIKSNMGKKRFPQLYVAACRSLGVSKLSLKLSHFCSRYSSSKNYAGIIIYHHNGNYKWHNQTGVAKGYNCRSAYVLILCTDDWPPEAFSRAGQGLVHDYMYRKMFGRSYSDKVSCCGGFAVMKGQTKYSSIWLNQQSSSNTGLRWESDGSKNLSNEEKVLVDLAVSEWKRSGGNRVVHIPDQVDTIFRLVTLST